MAPVYKGCERRRYKRLKKPFMVKLRVHSIGISKKRVEHDIIFLKDLSAGGLLFNYNRAVSKGTYLNFNIKFPRFRQAIICRGKVLRIGKPKDIPQWPLYYVAVCFVEAKQIGTMERILKKHFFN